MSIESTLDEPTTHRSKPSSPVSERTLHMQSPILQSSRHRRYQVWAAQQDSGMEPCFATPRRFVCDEQGCPWRDECLSLRAEWKL
jgi:hypothetical protein